LVSITAGCDSIQPWAALIVGAIGGVLMLGVSALLLRLRIDDPIDAFAVHGGPLLLLLLLSLIRVFGCEFNYVLKCFRMWHLGRSFHRIF
jgi:nitrate reductase gamma subunit